MFKAVCQSVALAILAGSLASPVLADDQAALIESGRKQFIRCAACHSLEAGESSDLGPHLAGIVGRTAGTVEDFDYEIELMREQTIVWDEEQLDAWLEQPHELIPGMCESFRGLRRPAAREALIAYLKEF